MTDKHAAPADKASKEATQVSRDLEVKSGADAIKGGVRHRKGGDPEEGGE